MLKKKIESSLAEVERGRDSEEGVAVYLHGPDVLERH